MKLNVLYLIVFSTAAQAAPTRDLIVGGQNVSRRDPIAGSTVGIFSPNPDGRTGALCSGTLIKGDIALTAAHCIEPGAKPVVIFDRDLHAPGAPRRVAEGVAVNPKWRTQRRKGMDQGDIALVKFGGSLPAGYHAVPAAGAELPQGSPVTLAGYGITNARTHEGAGILRKTRVRVLNARPGKSEMVLDQSHGHGACHGDSGGPAYVRSGGHVAVAGLTNRSYPNSAPDDCAHDVVYTKVPAYRNWIQASEKKLENAPPPPLREGIRARAHPRAVSAKSGKRRLASAKIRRVARRRARGR